MKLRFSPQATRDLVEIADYIRAENPRAAERVRAAILDSLGLLVTFPRLGRKQSVEGVRKLVTRRYGYFAYYLVDEAASEIVLLSIQHPSRSRPVQDR